LLKISGEFMKKIVVLGAMLALSGTASADSFFNGGFEDGNVGKWEVGSGYRGNTANPNLSAASFLAGGALAGSSQNGPQVSVVGPGNDPNVGALLNQVYKGSYSARIGDTTTGGNGGAIAQTVVNYGATTLNFSWAAVVEPYHTLTDAPIFSVKLLDLTAGTTIYSTNFLAAAGASTAGLFKQSNDPAYLYAPWQDVSLNTVIGHTYRMELFAADCQPTGHLGYAYLDGFGSVSGGNGDNGTVVTPPTGNVPVPASVALVGLGLMGLLAKRKKA
jgi:PEP-CTERM motif